MRSVLLICLVLASAPALASDPIFSDAEVCASPCLLLASTPLDQASTEYCKRCGDKVATACTDAWLDPCGADDLRNCVYAAYGQPFKKRKWQERFGKEGWYTPKKSAAKLSRVAADNVAELLQWQCWREKDSEKPGQIVEPQADGIYRVSVDLDGDGKAEDVVIDTETVTIGTSSKKLREPLGDGAGVEIIDLKTSDHHKELAIVPTVIEDDGSYMFVGFYDGKTTLMGEAYFGGGRELRGDGTMRTENSNCGVTIKETWRLRGRKVVLEKKKTIGRYDAEQCAACPFVFVGTHEGYAFQGSIIRNLVGPSAAASQSLGLVIANDDGRLELRIAERESETSYLDEVFVTVDGVRVESDACLADAGGPSCTRDGAPLVLRYGDSLDLTFTLPPGSTEARVELWAEGYYVPDL